jgi:hypothetical protein
VDKARNTYNRNADKDTIADILKRIQKYSEDLNLGVAMDIQQRLTHQNIIRMWNQCQRKNGKFYILLPCNGLCGSRHSRCLHH